jgi:hypothetical protein
MASYIYLDHLEKDMRNRFSIEGADPGEIRGLDQWKEYISLLTTYLSDMPGSEKAFIRERVEAEVAEFFSSSRAGQGYSERFTENLILLLLLQKLRRFGPLENPCPRLFISHRQPDWPYAIRIAQIAENEGFDYWVDVLDPALKYLARNIILPAYLVPLLTACIIEMALINCTHVICCMTPQSRGSLWIPYEYGRITEIPGYWKKAAAWLHPQLPQADYPEYMLLGETYHTETAIGHWLQSEFRIWYKQPCADKIDRIGDERIEHLPEPTNQEREVDDYMAWIRMGCPATQKVIPLEQITVQRRRLR